MKNKPGPRCVCRFLSNSTRTHIVQTILDPKTSRRIFELARDQQDELGRPDAEDEDEDVIEDDFTRPRTRDLELADDDDDDDEEQFPGLSGDEERELVRPSDYRLFPFFIQLVDLSGYRRGRHSGARRAALIQRWRT